MRFLRSLLKPGAHTFIDEYASSLLGDGQGLGRFLADFIGYRVRPAGTLLVASLAFWSFPVWRLGRSSAEAR